MTFWIGPAGHGPLNVIRAAVVGDRLRRSSRCQTMSGSARRDLGRDPDVGEAVVEEVHVVEDVLDAARRRGRRRAGARTRPTSPRTVAERSAWSCVPSVVRLASVAGAGRRRASGRAMFVADLVEVALEGLDDRVGVAPLERRQDRGVEVGRPLRVGARDDERDVGPRERLERAPDLLERARCRRARRSGRGSGRRPRPRRGRRRRGPRPASPRGGRRARRGPRRSCGAPRAGRPATSSVERTTYASRISRRDGPADAGAAERRDLDDAERLEAAQRLADRRLAGAELAGDLGLDDPRVGRVAAGRGCPRGGGP